LELRSTFGDESRKYKFLLWILFDSDQTTWPGQGCHTLYIFYALYCQVHKINTWWGGSVCLFISVLIP
jgi:hypothetical protein